MIANRCLADRRAYARQHTCKNEYHALSSTGEMTIPVSASPSAPPSVDRPISNSVVNVVKVGINRKESRVGQGQGQGQGGLYNQIPSESEETVRAASFEIQRNQNKWTFSYFYLRMKLRCVYSMLDYGLAETVENVSLFPGTGSSATLAGDSEHSPEEEFAA